MEQRAGRRLMTAIVVAGLTAGCGTSVADADGRRPAPPTRTPPASAFCVAARGQTEALRPLLALAQRPSASTQEIGAAADVVRRSNSNLLTTAPADLVADVQRYVDALDQQLDALTGPGTAAAAPDATSAAQRVIGYVTSNCPQRS